MSGCNAIAMRMRMSVHGHGMRPKTVQGTFRPFKPAPKGGGFLLAVAL